jgi:hypothetical protein
MSHKIHIDGTFFHRTSSLYPAIPVALDINGGFTVGAYGTAADGSPNLAFKRSVTLASSGSGDINLFSINDALGQTVEAVELHVLILECVTPGGKGTITKGASNGFTGFGSSYTLGVAAECPLIMPSGAGLALSGTDCVVTLTNTTATSATFNAYILARK